MNDDSLMPIGPYRGKPLKDVPDQHLLDIEKDCCPELKEYIQDNMDAILLNIAREESDPLNYNPKKHFYDE